MDRLLNKLEEINMIDEYMTERRHSVDVFMEQKWAPDFMALFIDESAVLKNLEKATTKRERQQIMLEFTKAASKEISNRRDSLMDSLDEIERVLKEAIEYHYADMVAINQALTAHLYSAAKVTTARKELLEQLKIKPEQIVPIHKINNSIEKIISFEGRVEDLLK
jgi:hypothetical protein